MLVGTRPCVRTMRAMSKMKVDPWFSSNDTNQEYSNDDYGNDDGMLILPTQQFTDNIGSLFSPVTENDKEEDEDEEGRKEEEGEEDEEDNNWVCNNPFDETSKS